MNACGPAATEGWGTVRMTGLSLSTSVSDESFGNSRKEHRTATRPLSSTGVLDDGRRPQAERLPPYSRRMKGDGAAVKMTDDTYVPKSPLACRSSKRCTCRFLCAGDPATEYSLSLNSRPIIRSTICSERVRK